MGSKIQKPIALDETLKQVVQKLHTQNLLLNVMAGESLEATETMAEIRKIVQNGHAQDVFNIGDQIVVPWTDITTGKTYNAVLNIVHFGNVTLKDGSEVPGMYVQWHYATPFGVSFDNYEAFYYAEQELPAGTYYITVGATWGDNCVKDATYHFTLTKPVPAGGQLSGFRGMPDQAAANWKVYSYESATAKDPIETVSVTAGAQGTSLGTLLPAGDGTLNSLHRTAYGYNRWSQSAIRQWLNSEAGIGEWWTPQNNFDRQPDQLASKAGFLSGFDEEFLSCIQPIKVTTALNTVTDAGDGDTEDTYDKVFLPSIEQMYIKPQLAGVEGEYFEYWKHASELTAPMEYYQTYPQVRTYAIENHASAQYVRLRSAYRGYANNTWYIHSSGYVNYHYAVYAGRCAPACVIC